MFSYAGPLIRLHNSCSVRTTSGFFLPVETKTPRGRYLMTFIPACANTVYVQKGKENPQFFFYNIIQSSHYRYREYFINQTTWTKPRPPIQTRCRPLGDKSQLTSNALGETSRIFRTKAIIILRCWTWKAPKNIREEAETTPPSKFPAVKISNRLRGRFDWRI